MGKTVRCPECSKVYRSPDDLEELRDNDSICMVCNAPIEVADWDRILASWDDEEDLDDVDDDLDEDWSDDEDDEDDDFGEEELDDEDDDFQPVFDDGAEEEEEGDEDERY